MALAIRIEKLAALGLITMAVMLGVLGGTLATYFDHTFAASATQGNLRILYAWDDGFYNYDFTNYVASSTGADWAMSMLFWNNATIDKVKNQVYGDLGLCGSAQHALVSDSDPTYYWDDDGGIKTPCAVPCYASSYHMRIYAPSWDFLYNVGWGYYVIGSTHRDANEACALPWVPHDYGWSEQSEDWFTQHAMDRGYSASSDWSYWYNYEAFRVEGDHRWDDNGYATAVNVP